MLSFWEWPLSQLSSSTIVKIYCYSSSIQQNQVEISRKICEILQIQSTIHLKWALRSMARVTCKDQLIALKWNSHKNITFKSISRLFSFILHEFVNIVNNPSRSRLMRNICFHWIHWFQLLGVAPAMSLRQSGRWPGACTVTHHFALDPGLGTICGDLFQSAQGISTQNPISTRPLCRHP